MRCLFLYSSPVLKHNGTPAHTEVPVMSICFDDFIARYRVPAHTEYEPEHRAHADIAVIYYTHQHECDDRYISTYPEMLEPVIYGVEYNCLRALYKEYAQKSQQYQQ